MTRCCPGKTLQVINALGTGGAEKLLVDFVITAKKVYHWDIDVLTLFDDNAYEDRLNNAKIRIFNLNLAHKYDIKCLLKLIKIIKDGKYSFIHVHLFPASFYVAMSTLFIKTKNTLILTEHSIWNKRRSFFGFKLLDTFIYSRFKTIVCVSENVRKALLEWLPSLKKKAVVINNAVALPKSEVNVRQKFDLIFVGRLVKAKGIDILLDAIARLKAEGFFVRTAIVGDGPLRASLREKAIALGIENLVEFLGLRKDVPDLMQQSKIFVLPSRWEGLPLALLEAMGLGIPIIAAAVGGVTNLIQNGRDGLLVPKENFISLKDAIVSLLTNHEMRQRLAFNGKRKFEMEYSIERYVIRVCNLYFALEK